MGHKLRDPDLQFRCYIIYHCKMATLMVSNDGDCEPTKMPWWPVYRNTVLARVITAVRKHHVQSNLEVRGLCGLCFQTTVHHWRKPGQELKQGRNLEAGVDDAKPMGDGGPLAACFPWLAQPAFLSQPGLPAQGWSYPQCAGPLPSVTNFKKTAVHTCVYSLTLWRDPFNWSSSS